MARLSSGWDGCRSIASPAAAASEPISRLGLNDGYDTIARIPPVSGSSATTAPRRVPSAAAAVVCRSLSMVSRRPWGRRSPPSMALRTPEMVESRSETRSSERLSSKPVLPNSTVE